MAKFSLLTTLTLNASGYNKGVDRAKAKTQSFAKGVNEAGKSIKGSFGQITHLAGGVGGEFGMLAQSVGGGVSAFKKMIPAINGFKTALISTGIGALIVGLGTAVASLTSYFKKTEEGQMAFKKVMNAVSAYIEPVLSLVNKLGKAVFELFKGNFKEAWKTVKDGFKQVGDEIKNNVGNLDELNKAEQDLLTLQRENLLKNKKLQAEISELRNKGKDKELYTAEQRKKYLDLAVAKQKEYSRNQLKEADLELKIAEIKASFGDNDIETNNQINELRAKQFDIQKEQADKLREILETSRSITNEIQKQRDLAFEQVAKTAPKAIEYNSSIIKSKKEQSEIEDEILRKKNEQLNKDNFEVEKLNSYSDALAYKAEKESESIDSSKSFLETIATVSENANAVAGAIGGAFGVLSNSIIKSLNLADTGLGGFIAKLAETATQLISMFLAESMAAAIKAGSISAAFTGAGAIFAQPAFIAQAIAGVSAAFAAIPKFATGGIVGGTSFGGDNLTARVNSGEMILNQAQQSRLFAMANNGGSGGNVTFEISGDRLIGVLNNYNKKVNLFR